jgi:arylsulfatase
MRLFQSTCLGALIATGVSSALTSIPVSAAKPIIHDAEFTHVKTQYQQQWQQDDKQLQQVLAALKQKTGKRPNIIHVMWDDNSLGEVGIPEMNKVLGIDTPRINQMADEGISFTRMYSEPSCTPTRTAALTGRLAVRAAMTKVGFPPDGMGLHKDEITIAEVLSKAGYKTAFVGKAHQGDIESSYMNHQGFDYANFSMYNQFPYMTWQPQMIPGGGIQGFFPSQWDKHYTLDKKFRPLAYINQLEGRKGEKPKVYGGTSAQDYKKLLKDNKQQLLDYIKTNANNDKPFYMAYWPHLYDFMLKPNELTTNGNTPFSEGLKRLDRDIGDLLDLLTELGMAENTLVVAMADNGPMHELAPKGPRESIFRGGKGDYLEGGIRVPAFAWWPGTIQADQVVGDMISVHDLFTTFASLGKADKYIPRDRVIDGIDQTALLLNGDGHSRRDYLHIYTGEVLAASIKQQIKRVWVGDRPGLVGDGFTDLYKDPREEHHTMPPYLWAWAPFDHMKARHLKQIEKYPHRKENRDRPYKGIEGVSEETEALGLMVEGARE